MSSPIASLRLAGHTPFPDAEHPATYADRVYRHARASHPAQSLSAQLRDLLRELLRVDPARRLSAKDALRDLAQLQAQAYVAQAQTEAKARARARAQARRLSAREALR